MNAPWLTVVMPTYNGERWLRESLSSICVQNDRDIEVLLIDDGSTDSTVAIAEEFCNRLSMQIIRRTHVGNWVSSVNIGLAQAGGQYLCILHQDDIWEPHRLSIIRQVLTEHPEAAIVMHPSYFIDKYGRRVGRWSCPLPRQPDLLSRDIVWERLLVQNFVASCAPVFRRDAALQTGPLDEALWYTADWDYWLKLAARGKTLFCPETLLCVRVHRTSQTHMRAVNNDGFRQQYEIVLDRYLAAWGTESSSRQPIARRARYSAELNIALAARVAGTALPWPKILAGCFWLGPAGIWRYLRDSRIHERTFSRMRAGLG